jgi:hypothetical protein
MPLQASMIYRRTDRGVREVYEKSHQFTQSERLILILLDGRLTVAGLQARLPSLNDERVARALGKLQDAGLVEPIGASHAVRSDAALVAGVSLEPEAVAHFLEQTDLDPVTVFGDTDEAVAIERVRASVEQAAAQLAREAAGESAPRNAPPSIRKHISGRRKTESGRSHDDRLSRLRPTTEVQWEGGSTHFAITTVNVPDRLDLQEERDRAESESWIAERLRTELRIWMKRLLVVAVFAVIGAGLYGWLEPLRADTSAASVAERLTAVLRRPVSVADTEFRFSPTPRLIIRGIAVGDFVAEEVSLLINWKDLWSAVRGGQWVWGEATVAPLTITPSQALTIGRTLPGGAKDLPDKISTIRFQSVRIADSRLFPSRYEAVLRRAPDGNFGPLVLRQLDGEGAMQLSFRAAKSADNRDVLDFRLDADRWMPPIGPRVRWNETQATGRLDGTLIEVSNFSLAGFFGVISGTVYAASDVEWVITGIAGASNIDVESVLTALRPGAQNAEEAPPTAVQGTASLDLTVVGRGPSLDDALARSAVAGPFRVRWATLNGINLGLAATQGATAAGITRFTEFGGLVAASANGVRFEDTGGRAGAMAARGDFTVAPDLALAGGLRVEMGTEQRIQMPASLRIRGTVLSPRFGP